MSAQTQDNKAPEGITLAGKTYQSRLLVGTGKYRSMDEAVAAIKASQAEIITVAVRRIDLSDPTKKTVMDYLSPKEYTYLPNTAGCFTGEEAIRTLRLARELWGGTLVKLEVLADKKTLYPDMLETIKATELLVKDGFDVMAYTTDDPIMVKHVEEAGATAVMPLAAPIGSGMGIQNPTNIRMIVESANVPVLVDAGVGTASDAAVAMELGCDGVLMNTAIAEAKDPVKMATAMRLGVEAGREAFLAGRMPKKHMADPSSPTEGLL
jgi:thiazole synthase